MTTFYPQITIGPITTNFAIQLLDNGQLRYEVVDFDLDYDTGEEGEVLFPDDCKRGSQPWALAQAFIDRLTERLERGFVVQMYEVGQAYGGPEEGGWWYDYGQPRDHWFRTTLAEAIALKEELEEVYNEDRTTETDFHLAIHFDQDTTGWPKTRPHYS